MICMLCGETIVEGIVDNALEAEARKFIHHATKHEPVLGAALTIVSSLAISWAVARMFNALADA